MLEIGVGFAELFEAVHDILEDVEVIDFRRFDNTVENGAGIGTGGGLAEQPVFSADDERFNGSLCAVIVDGKETIESVTHQFMPLIKAVLYCLSEFGFG